MRLFTLIYSGALLSAATPAAGQAFPEEYKNAFKDRVTEEQVTTITSENAGYYRLVFEGINTGNATACPNRQTVQSAGGKMWELVFDKKREWGISAIATIPSASEGIDPTKIEAALIKVTGTGSRECSVTVSAENVKYRSPMFPISNRHHNYGNEVQVTLTNWYSEKADANRVSLLWKGIGGAVSLLVPGSSILTDAVTTRAESETSKLLDKKIGAEFTHVLRTGSAFNPILLRLGPAGDNAGKVRITLKPVGSVYATGADYPDLTSALPTDILGTLVGDKPKAISTRVDQKVRENLRDQTDIAGFQSACEPMFVELARIGLSDVDQAIYVWAMALQHAKVGAAKAIGVKCLNERTSLLAKVKIKLAPLVETTSVSRDGLLALMNAVADRQSGPFAPTVQLSGELDFLGYAGVPNTVATNTELTRRLFERGDIKIGCFAPNTGSAPDTEYPFPSDMIGVDSALKPRLGATLMRFDRTDTAPERLFVLLFRVDGAKPGATALINGVHILSRPDTLLMRDFQRCRTTHLWTAPLLTP